MDLIFSISVENFDNEAFLAVQFMDKISSRVLAFAECSNVSQSDKELVQLVSKTSVRSKNDNIFYSKGSSSFSLVQKLYASKKLFWKGRSVFWNPLSKVTLQIDVEELDVCSLAVSSQVQIDGVRHTLLSLEAFFIGAGKELSWGICKQVLFTIPKGVPYSFLAKIYPGPVILEGKERVDFIEEYKDDPLDGVFIEWKVNSQNPLPVFPVLLLRDLHGAFADLQMEYRDFTIDFVDPKPFLGRNVLSEKGWENDLLETDFIRKEFVDSHYYCPMDKVAKSLSFLLDIGWKILDKKGRHLLKLAESHLDLSSQKDGFLVRGSFRYQDHEVDLVDVVGAFNRRERFIELSANSIGWLDESEKAFAGIKELGEVEKVSGGCFFRKKQIGLLESISGRSDLNPASVSLLERLSSFSFLEQKENGILFQGKLHPYQEEGRRWLTFLYQNGFSGLLADEMGLGKTVQTLSFLSELSVNKPILLVVPTSLIFNWKREWEKFLPHKKLYVHAGAKRSLQEESLQNVEAIITSYAYLRIDYALFSQMEFSVVILDEAQLIKNSESQLAKAAFMLQAKMRLCLTGTPVENRADDLWSLFHFLEPELLGEKKEFLSALASSQLDDRYRKKIRKLIRPFILRRLKETVAKDLPDKIEQEVYVEMGEKQRAFYEGWLARAKQGLLQKVQADGLSKHRMEVLETILRLRQICCHPALVEEGQVESAKIDKVLCDLAEVLEENRKVLIYSQFTQLLRSLEKEVKERGWKHVYLDGETKDREKVVVAFQEDPSISLFLISLKAGGVGLNLTAADYVFLLDPWWNDAVERQAIDRAHRFGRKHTVVARRYITAMSIEEKIMKLKSHKTALAKGLLDFDQVEESFALQDLIELIT